MRDPQTWTPGLEAAEPGTSATSPGGKPELQAGVHRTWVRVATVMLYVVCVSLAAAVLALYYGLMWRPTAGPGPTRTRTDTLGVNKVARSSKNFIYTTLPVPFGGTRSTEVPVGVTDTQTFSPGTASPQAGQGFTSPAETTAEDPANLPTHPDPDRDPDPEQDQDPDPDQDQDPDPDQDPSLLRLLRVRDGGPQ